MSKSKKNQPKISTGAIIAIVIGVVLVVAIITDGIISNNNSYTEEDTEEESCSYGYTACGDTCLSCQDGYYLGSDCKCYPTKETQYELDYEKADTRWQQYVQTLVSDEERLGEIIDDYCNGISTGNEIQQCVNLISPVLNSYTTHITNAQTFMQTNADIFGNDIELLAYLDDKAVYAQTLANNVNSMVNDYNSKQASSGSEIDDETIETILKILALAI